MLGVTKVPANISSGVYLFRENGGMKVLRRPLAPGEEVAWLKCSLF